MLPVVRYLVLNGLRWRVVMIPSTGLGAPAAGAPGLCAGIIAAGHLHLRPPGNANQILGTSFQGDSEMKNVLKTGFLIVLLVASGFAAQEQAKPQDRSRAHGRNVDSGTGTCRGMSSP